MKRLLPPCVRAALWLRRSVVLYPVTEFYLGAVVVVMLLSADRITLSAAVLTLTILGVIVFLLSLWYEVRRVHFLVDSQRIELLARIDQLVGVLLEANVPVPDQQDAEQRAQTRQESGV